MNPLKSASRDFWPPTPFAFPKGNSFYYDRYLFLKRLVIIGWEILGPFLTCCQFFFNFLGYRRRESCPTKWSLSSLTSDLAVELEDQEHLPRSKTSLLSSSSSSRIPLWWDPCKAFSSQTSRREEDNHMSRVLEMRSSISCASKWHVVGIQRWCIACLSQY